MVNNLNSTPLYNKSNNYNTTKLFTIITILQIKIKDKNI